MIARFYSSLCLKNFLTLFLSYRKWQRSLFNGFLDQLQSEVTVCWYGEFTFSDTYLRGFENKSEKLHISSESPIRWTEKKRVSLYKKCTNFVQSFLELYVHTPVQRVWKVSAQVQKYPILRNGIFEFWKFFNILHISKFLGSNNKYNISNERDNVHKVP
jgi:hypothetical protein